MGTGETGSGASARHSCSASTGAGTTGPTSVGSAIAFDRTNVVPVTDACVRFDVAAQHVSACTCVSWCRGVEPRVSALCIGHVDSSSQHAIRAAAEACHPAQTDRWPRHSVRAAVSAASRLANVVTSLGCELARSLSNRAVGMRNQGCHRLSCIESPV